MDNSQHTLVLPLPNEEELVSLKDPIENPSIASYNNYITLELPLPCEEELPSLILLPTNSSISSVDSNRTYQEESMSLNFPSTNTSIPSNSRKNTLKLEESSSINEYYKSDNSQYTLELPPPYQEESMSLNFPSDASNKASANLESDNSQYTLELPPPYQEESMSLNFPSDASNKASANLESLSLKSIQETDNSDAVVIPNESDTILNRQLSNKIFEELMDLGRSTRQTSMEIMDIWDEKYHSTSLTNLDNVRGTYKLFFM